MKMNNMIKEERNNFTLEYILHKQWIQFLSWALCEVCDINPFMLTGAFNICCPRDCVSRHNGGTSGAPLNPSETIVLSEHYRLWGFKGGARGKMPPLCRETSVSRTANVGTVGKNGLNCNLFHLFLKDNDKFVLKNHSVNAKNADKFSNPPIIPIELLIFRENATRGEYMRTVQHFSFSSWGDKRNLKK